MPESLGEVVSDIHSSLVEVKFEAIYCFTSSKRSKRGSFPANSMRA